MKQFATFRLGGKTWTAHYVTKAEMRALHPAEELEAQCDYEQCKLYVRRFRNLDQRRDAFLHEVCHAFLESTGIGNLMQSNYSGADFVKFEEDLIRLFVPHLATFLDDLKGHK